MATLSSGARLARLQLRVWISVVAFFPVQERVGEGKGTHNIKFTAASLLSVQFSSVKCIPMCNKSLELTHLAKQSLDLLNTNYSCMESYICPFVTGLFHLA